MWKLVAHELNVSIVCGENEASVKGLVQPLTHEIFITLNVELTFYIPFPYQTNIILYSVLCPHSLSLLQGMTLAK